MERRFKLIDDYPGHEELGKIGTTRAGSLEKDTDVFWCHFLTYFQEWSKFWQEIFPVAFKHKDGRIYKLITTYGNYRYYRHPIYLTLDVLHGNEVQEIYWHESDIPREKDWEVIEHNAIPISDGSIEAVKWLPTGEVFRVGDWVKWESYTGGWLRPEKIVRFVIREDFCSAEFESDQSRVQMKNLHKADPPILITEDGVPFWKGDKAVFISNYYLKYPEKIDYRICEAYCDGNGVGKYFSTIEAAKNYIEKHSRKYSLKEIREVLINDGFSSGYVDERLYN